jgi:TPR repeat protein
MKTKPLTFLLALTFLFLFGCSNSGDDLQDGKDAFKRNDYKETVRLFRLSAEQGYAQDQFNMGAWYEYGIGVDQDLLLAHMWYNLAGSNGHKDGPKYKNILEKKMTPQQIEKAQEMARNWKPKK